ncbi:MAG: VCBS repeat-containing protein [Bacteroidota bacterium]
MGETLANTYCGNCHLVPEPTDLTRAIWLGKVLPQMGAMYGVYESQPRSYYLNGPQAPFIEDLYPEERLLDSADWANIVAYYLNLSLDELPERQADLPLDEMTQFIPTYVEGDTSLANQPQATMIAFDPERRQICVGGAYERTNQLLYFSPQHSIIDTRPANSSPVAFIAEEDLVLEIGSLLPSDIPIGGLSSLTEDGKLETLLDSLLRPVDMLKMDLDLNGQNELIIAEYGNLKGRISAYEWNEYGQLMRKYILIQQAGAIRLRKADLNGDGNDDLIAMFGQGDESVKVAYSRSDGSLKMETLLRFPPSYGSSDIEVIDFDKDGHLDLLTTNGDNYDYQPFPKPYHGIRYFRNQGDNSYQEEWFYYLDGAYGVEVADFDLDGDNDIAAIAYFVPPTKRSVRSFVYLQQEPSRRGRLNFRAYSFRKPAGQYYLCLSSGDVDQDGDIDLLLGNFGAYLPDGMFGRSNRKEAQAIYIYLDNQAK